ncbi:hypothetical protein [Nocardia brasiliensis]|uniref:Uncharacterized protein n=1 Tax=Nocardia brasiliensis (strain ATCC 700358 / HUJEG-1) TaxID=1133849 RepID=K0ENX5_NOCB7|nr:hypothetical protein [Nocardia brasiliensis]AFU01313.1 hypothetical protein O3I_016760 [Nocardia brasiliensis ATCC 700358]OCF86663.1 hypothetical protein AW168_29845 [Nocardia brasiliensis]
MGIVVETVQVSNDADTGSAIEHAVRAARACVAEVGDAGIHTFINTGIYRDRNIVEPAVAALIQKRAEIGLRYASDIEPVLSFDLMNGPCGFLGAVEVCDAILRTRGSGRCLVVAGDGHPSTDPARSFPYASTGAAAVLKHVAQQVGFGKVYGAATTGKFEPHGYVDLAEMGATGRETLSFGTVFDEDEVFKTAVRAAQDCLDAEHIEPATTTLVTTQPVADFGARVAAELGFGLVVAAPAGYGRDPHTAASLVAYAAATADGPAADLLLLAAGAGPVAAASVYRRPATRFAEQGDHR